MVLDWIVINKEVTTAKLRMRLSINISTAKCNSCLDLDGLIAHFLLSTSIGKWQVPNGLVGCALFETSDFPTIVTDVCDVCIIISVTKTHSLITN